MVWLAEHSVRGEQIDSQLWKEDGYDETELRLLGCHATDSVDGHGQALKGRHYLVDDDAQANKQDQLEHHKLAAQYSRDQEEYQQHSRYKAELGSPSNSPLKLALVSNYRCTEQEKPDLALGPWIRSTLE